jgi:signal transduction histidine kinase
MRRYFKIVLIFISLGGYCQTAEDSLLMQLDYLEEEERNSINYELFLIYRDSEPAKALKYARRHLAHSQKFHNTEDQVVSYRILGISHMNTNKFDSALYFLEKAYNLADSLGIRDEMISIIGNLGIINSKRNNYLKSVEYYLNFIELAKEMNDNELLASGYNNIGLVYYRIGDVHTALEFYNKCIDTKIDNNIDEGLMINYNNLGLCYIRLKKYELAFNAFKYSIEFNNKNNINHISNAYYGIGNSYYGLNNKLRAIEYYELAISLTENTFNYRTLLNSYFQISSIYNELGNYEISLEYAKKCLELYAQKKLSPTPEPYILISTIYENIGNIRKALEYKNIYIHLSDSLLSNKHLAEVKNLLRNHQLAENERIIKSKNIKIKRSREFAYMFSILLFLVSIVLLFAYRNIKIRKKLNEKLISLVEQRTKDFNSLLYRTSHDLAGPVASLKGLIELMAMSKNKKDIDSYLLRMNITNKRLEIIIQKLNEVSKINSKTLKFENVDLKSTVSNIIKNVNNGFSNEMIIQFTGEKIFKTDKTLLNTVIQNILLNSIQHSDHREEKHIVNVDIRNKKNLIVKISDNGKGIEQKYSHKIFDLFYVATDNSKGNGLGLYQAKLAAERLNGDIKLISTKKPITFEISIQKQKNKLIHQNPRDSIIKA